MPLLSKERPNWSSHKLSRSICDKFVRDGVLVTSETWYNTTHEIDEYARVIQIWLEKEQSNRVVNVSLFDPGVFRKLIHKYDIDTSRVTFIDQSKICFWLLVVNQYFLDYKDIDLLPGKFLYKFLCYQRKPTAPRKELYQALKDKQGIVTLGNKKFDINKNIPSHNGLTEAVTPYNLAVLNDIYSLGNPDIWNSAFLNIVSETKQDFNDDHAFISEKTFKPIIGLRPFICFANPNLTKQLKQMGFETFDDDFGYKPCNDEQRNIKMISDIVDDIDFEPLNNARLYNTFLPKLQHNKNWLPKAAKIEWNKIEELVNEQRAI